MSYFEQKRRWKYFLLITATMIGILSLYYTNYLVDQISESERKGAELWAKSQLELAETEDEEFIDFLLFVVKEGTSVPVIVVNGEGDIQATKDLDSTRTFKKETASLSGTNGNKSLKYDPGYFRQQLEYMREQHEPIVWETAQGVKQYAYYKDSWLLTQMRYFPYIQLSIITVFLVVAYLAFSNSRRSEQNKVWVGMSKETAHQLGTPISSMMAWMELLKDKYNTTNDPIFEEMDNDVNRLQLIADRFSKIGSTPVLKRYNIREEIVRCVGYLRKRTSKKITFEINGDPAEGLISTQLFEWVIENLCRNAANAIGGNEGKISIHISQNKSHVYVDIKDTGVGIPRSKHETVFQPGYTTRKRGWGLGLSLTRRIVENYHKGQVFVRESEVGKGTTFRVVLNK
ncbi:histidine kinase/DNA gyrase B/HSP90-like ATPase [Anseongella ginsenosidimutans]|uniref:histidine kinase n=1 Tax=Anseongella ginsenosidimutans TaxID=496056 RepID=A0A4R3KVM8_9SPHI|nr:HAMP domain-containing sensor histidine kinase [Anseongella ginsenosidimutans]QEC51809.1 HAMP domain-containing histidine kinase [Anseongella ginsenosidimutans]TCS89181.1 histidine kinase/DNA gyrase B/HSP90-like ATPase [Anseongella ginsenosidimutans]